MSNGNDFFFIHNNQLIVGDAELQEWALNFASMGFYYPMPAQLVLYWQWYMDGDMYNGTLKIIGNELFYERNIMGTKNIKSQQKIEVQPFMACNVFGMKSESSDSNLIALIKKTGDMWRGRVYREVGKGYADLVSIS